MLSEHYVVDVHPILEIASRLTVAGLLALIAIALVRGWLVPRYRYLELQREILELKAERNEWRRLALQGTRIADTAVRVADQAFCVQPTEHSTSATDPKEGGHTNEE